MADSPSADSGPLILPPHLAARYDVISRLKVGSYGTVDLIQHRSTSVQYAVKCIRYYESDELREEYESEIEIMSSLYHENVVTLIESYDDLENARLILVMEYCRGGDLADLIDLHRTAGTNLDETEIWRILVQVIRALDCLHFPPHGPSAQDREFPVFHRDIKAANIMYDGSMIKITDFGASRIMDDGEMTNSTEMGTRQHIAPEQAREGDYGLSADLWASGVLLFHLAQLSFPFSIATINAGMTARGFKVPLVGSLYSAALQDLLGFVLRIDPSHRYDTRQILALPRMLLAGIEVDQLRVELDQRHVADNLRDWEKRLTVREATADERDLKRAEVDSRMWREQSEIDENVAALARAQIKLDKAFSALALAETTWRDLRSSADAEKPGKKHRLETGGTEDPLL